MKKQLLQGFIWGVLMFLLNTFLFNIKEIGNTRPVYFLLQFLLWMAAGVVFGITTYYIQKFSDKKQNAKKNK